MTENQIPSGMPSMDSMPEADNNLSVPSHKPDIQDGKPSIIMPGENNSEVNIPPAPKKGIEVIAIRGAFFRQHRVKEGDKLIIKSEAEFGEWMKCVDPLMERKRKEFYKKKKAKK